MDDRRQQQRRKIKSNDSSNNASILIESIKILALLLWPWGTTTQIRERTDAAGTMGLCLSTTIRRIQISILRTIKIANARSRQARQVDDISI
jgi:hypothetical protein